MAVLNPPRSGRPALLLPVALLLLLCCHGSAKPRSLSSAAEGGNVIQLAQHLEQDAPSQGYQGMYDLQIVGMHYKVSVYYYMIPGTNEFWFKSQGTKVDIPWCGPYQYNLQDIGGGNFEIVPFGVDPHCGEKEQKEHPVKNLKRVWNSAANTITQTMETYTVWPVGWKSLKAECGVCSEPDCVCNVPGCSA